MELDGLFNSIYKGRKVLITGHTGFKGSWLAYWLTKMGADVLGYSLAAPTSPSHLELLKIDIKSIEGNILNRDLLEKTFEEFQPEIVFHLAAQPLVRYSYANPVETFETNIIGSMYIYEAIRKCRSVTSLVSITTDKVYHNNEWCWAYKEIDPLGGKDPYSASKAAMEILSGSYRDSFFQKEGRVLMATCRAGNVIGGGDWAEDRLIPDIVKSASEGKSVEIRSPESVRPWQHVLEPLYGYLLLGQKLIEKNDKFAVAYNFGPSSNDNGTVAEVLELSKKYWADINHFINDKEAKKMHEAGLLKVDSSKAMIELGWSPIWSKEIAIEKTINWYKDYYEIKKVNTDKDLLSFVKRI